MAIIIKLVGGPMDGVDHELFGSLVPSAIGINRPEEPESRIKHWYKVNDDEQSATYVSTCQMPMN